MWTMLGGRLGHILLMVETTTVMQELPERLRKGDAEWLKDQLEQGNLDELEPLLGPEQWPKFTEAVRAGDIGEVRNLLRNVNVPGVGPLVRSSRTGLWIVLAVVGVAVVALVVWLLLRGGDDGDDDEAAQNDLQTITATLAADPQYSTLSGLLEVSGLDESLNGDGPYTVFAPNDDAFAALPPDELSALQQDAGILEQVLSYQIVDGSYTVDDLPDGELTTVQGDRVTIATDGDDTTVNDASIVDPDVDASNGMIQGIDAVIVPPGLSLEDVEVPTEDLTQLLASNPDYSTVSALLVQSGFATVLGQTGPYTVFAPTNDAFAALPPDQLANLQGDNALLRQVLAYHGLFGRFPTQSLEPGELTTVEGQPVTIGVEGTTYTVNSATIVAPDMEATNGVAHGIDQVLVPPGVDLTPVPPETTTTAPPESTTTAPPGTTTTTTEPATTTTEAAVVTEDLYETLAGDERFDLFVRLIDAAELQDTLANAEEITVFAPTDGAFGADPEDAEALVDRVIDTLSVDELQDLLKYQAVPSVLPVDALEPGRLETFLTGESVTVVGSGEDATIEGDANSDAATIVAPDLEASNGVAQGIDKFLLPSGIELPD
jgi:uncharacterized surface protein with fasciclin (FAS1) repeats